jgi:hypothetical protein
MAGTHEKRAMQSARVLSRDRVVAGAKGNRWLVPSAALSIHLAIGSVYSWSVFKLPLHETQRASGLLSTLPFTLGIVMLGLSAAAFGTAVERRGPAPNTSRAAGPDRTADEAVKTPQLWLMVDAAKPRPQYFTGYRF